MTTNTEQRKLAAIMFTDMVGYSALSQRDEKLAQELLEEHRRLLREIFPRFHGTEIKTIGDAFLVEFNSALEAAQCAIEIQRALAHRNTDVTADRRIELRIGIHIGDVVHRGGDVYGDGVNIASRIQPLANVGGVCVSMDVERQIHNAIETRLEKLAPTELKNIFVPMELFRIVLPWEGRSLRSATTQSVSPRRVGTWVGAAIAAILLFVFGAGWWWTSRKPPRARSQSAGQTSTATIPEKSIAVLPFENLSSDKENAYFADGIQDEILTRLSKIADLKVISRTSTQHYKSAPENLSEVGKQLGVAHLVEGSVQKSADAVRVNVQLIRARDDSHIWADTFDRKITDIFSVETEVAKAIADQLGAHITGGEQQALSTKPTNIPEAYDAYLRGLAYNLRPGNTPTIAIAAQKYLREAVRLDPQFAIAWALLAEVDANGYNTTVLPKTPELLEEARTAADTAVGLQPNLGEAVYAKGYFYYGCLRDYDNASRYFEQARQLLPNSSHVLHGLAYIARRRGDWQGCVKWFEQGEQLDPRDVLALNQHALSLLALRRFGEALQKVDRVLDITPDSLDAILIKAAIFQAEGDLKQAGALLAPLQMPITNFVGLEAQLQQAIFERDPAAGVARLRPILERADPATGWFVGELRVWLGWAQKHAADAVKAQQTLQQARSELEASFQQQPQNSYVVSDLGLVNAMLGDKAAAFRYAQQAIEIDPPEKDGVYGPGHLEVLARVAALTGETDQAIAIIGQLLSTAYSNWGTSGSLTPALLRLDPMFDPLRNDPRFQKLCQEPND